MAVRCRVIYFLNIFGYNAKTYYGRQLNHLLRTYKTK